MKIGPFLRSPHLGVKVARIAQFSPGQPPFVKTDDFGPVDLVAYSGDCRPVSYIFALMPSGGQNIALQAVGWLPGALEMIEVEVDGVMDFA